MTTNEPSDMRRAMETHTEGQARQERLRSAARRVWEASRPDPADPNRVYISREVLDALGAALAET